MSKDIHKEKEAFVFFSINYSGICRCYFIWGNYINVASFFCRGSDDSI